MQPLVLAGLTGGLIGGVWLRVVGVSEAQGWSTLAPAALIGAGVTLAYLRRSAAGGVLTGLGSAWIWRPCVGAELGRILELGSTRPFSALAGTALFVAGVSLAPIAAVLAARATGRGTSPRWARTGLGVGALVSIATAAGLIGDLLGTLARWSV
jgi:cytochrome c biogenesis protein CcdA